MLSLPLDAVGFLDATAAIAGTAEEIEPGALVRPGVLARAGALVLLGEPGIGKTTTFEMITSGRPHEYVDAADVTDATYEDLVGRHLDELPEEGPGSASSDPSLVLVLDQIDDSPIVKRLANRLQRSLSGRDVKQLGLLLACRTADYPESITDALEAAGVRVTLADLAPLTRAEAEQLADSAEGVDGADLIDAAVEAGAGALASVPLTLSMLVRTYQTRGALDAAPRELFNDGVVQLADDHASQPSTTFVHSTADQRIAVARRAAARLLLSGRRSIWRGPQLEVGAHDLQAESLVGGRDPARTHVLFNVSPERVRETLRTALFTGRGDQRLAFRHGSIAAYLAASYLSDRDLPQQQLESLFLVPGAEGSRTIPTLLRETAAWLVTLEPQHARWLVQADPESLVSHSRIVDSDTTRALLVESLLERAGEVELGDVPWSRTRRRLEHPGLVTQLRRVLDEAELDEPEDWHRMARVRLAVRLARETRVPGLAEPLLRLASNDGWRAHLRQLAALTAYETEPDHARPALKELLDSLADEVYSTKADPDDELRGSLLDLLWPDHLDIVDLLPHLRPRQNQQLIGVYQRFQRTFATKLLEADLPTLLTWARSVDRPEMSPSIEAADTPQDELPTHHDSAEQALDEELLQPIVDRSLAGPTAADHIPDTAALLLPRLRGHDQPALPAGLDVEDSQGSEPGRCRDIRRAMARELLAQTPRGGERTRADIWMIVNGWSHRGRHRDVGQFLPEGCAPAGRSQLLTSADFRWAYEEAAVAATSGDADIALLLARLAAFLFDAADLAAVDLAYGNSEHPVWPLLKHWFEPVELESAEASRMRELHRDTYEDMDEDVDPEAEAFVASLAPRLQEVIEGDTDAFWQLVWDLQFDPTTLRGFALTHDDLRQFPGIAALDRTELLPMLVGVATAYLQAENDHRDSWLGTTRYDKRAWAGCIALALLEREDQLSELPESVWHHWVGALVWFAAVPVNAGDRELKARLLKRASTAAPTDLAKALAVYLRGELAAGRNAWEVPPIDPQWHPALAEAWLELLAELTKALIEGVQTDDVAQLADEREQPPPGEQQPPTHGTYAAADEGRALDLWYDLLRVALQTDDQAEQYASVALASFPDREQLAIRAALALVSHSAQDWWPRVRQAVTENDDFSRKFVLAAATSRDDSPLLTDMAEHDLDQIYRWLAELFPPENDRNPLGVHIVSPEQEASQWRDSFLHHLSTRGTDASVAALHRLSREYPERLNIASSLIRARALAGESGWTPPHPDQLASLLGDRRRRLVRSSAELTDVLLEVLEDIKSDVLQHGDLLWDRIPKRLLPQDDDAWLPKPEAALCSYLTNELRHRLSERSVVVNREVLVRPTDALGAGDRTDILVESPAINGSNGGPTYRRAATVIEVKGCWNPDLRIAQRTQLAERYLHEVGTDHGVYLVGWFPTELWTESSDGRRRYARACGSISDISHRLGEQAAQIQSELGLSTTPLLLPIPRSHPSNLPQ